MDMCTYMMRDRKVTESRVKKSILIMCKMNSELFSLCLFGRILFIKIVKNFNSQAYAKASAGVFS